MLLLHRLALYTAATGVAVCWQQHCCASNRKNALTAVFQRKAFNMHREGSGFKHMTITDYQEWKTQQDIQLKKASLPVKKKKITQLLTLTRKHSAFKACRGECSNSFTSKNRHTSPLARPCLWYSQQKTSCSNNMNSRTRFYLCSPKCNAKSNTQQQNLNNTYSWTLLSPYKSLNPKLT